MLHTISPTRVTPFGGLGRAPSRCVHLCRARPSEQQTGGATPPQANPFGDVDAEAREAELELLEARVRGAGVKKQALRQGVNNTSPQPPSATPKRVIPIRGMTQPQQQQDNSIGLAEWKDNALLPEGWESMNIGQQIYELYAGRRGALFWLNKAAYASVFILLGGWVIFRLVLPNLGLYKLDGDVVLPPL